MIKSESILKIIPALLEAKKEMSGTVIKKANNPFFKSKYADLNSVLEVCVDDLHRVGIVILQPIIEKNGKNYVQTLLIHDSGEFIGSECEIKVKNLNDPQAEGSGITYARRYSLQSLLGLASVDDDANKANNNIIEPVKQKTKIEVKPIIDPAVEAYYSKVEAYCINEAPKDSTNAYYTAIHNKYISKAPKLKDDKRFNDLVEKYKPETKEPPNEFEDALNSSKKIA